MAKQTKGQLILLDIVVTLVLLFTTFTVMPLDNCSGMRSNCNEIGIFDVQYTGGSRIVFLIISGLFNFYMFGKIGKK